MNKNFGTKPLTWKYQEVILGKQDDVDGVILIKFLWKIIILVPLNLLQLLAYLWSQRKLAEYMNYI